MIPITYKPELICGTWRYHPVSKGAHVICDMSRTTTIPKNIFDILKALDVPMKEVK